MLRSQVTFYVRVALVCLGWTALAWSPLAEAQSFSVIDTSGFVNSINLQATTNLGNLRQNRQSGDSYLAPRTPLNSAPSVSDHGKASLFQPSLTRRKANLANFVAKSRKVDPTGAAQMAQLFASNDPIVALGQDLKRYGLRTDNVADAYTVYWVQSWQAANGDTSDPSRATMQAVKQQSTNALASTPEFSAANDATKQEMAEAMMVQAMLISASVDVYKDDPNMMRQLGAAVRKGAKASGLDLDAMTLTDVGFVPARKTSAADPEPGTPEQALAANENTAPAASNPPYLLLAAAGGAGIGGVFMLGKMFGRRG